LLGSLLAWQASRRSEPRIASFVAIAVNAAALAVVLVAIFLFGGS
jgi:hypothetical protein